MEREKTPSILEAKIKGTMDHQMIDGVRNKSEAKHKCRGTFEVSRILEINT